MKLSGLSLLPAACALLICLHTTAHAATAAGKLVLVDVERVLKESVPAQAARKHLEDVRRVLQKGMDALEKEWKDAPEAKRREAFAEALGTLNHQMAREEAAANAVVVELLREECEKWRATHGAVAVAPRQSMLAAGAEADITAEILDTLNKRVPTFAALPSVDVKKRGGRPTSPPGAGKPGAAPAGRPGAAPARPGAAPAPGANP